MSALWNTLLATAQEEVKSTLEALPEELREQATPLQVSYERRPNRAILRDGDDEDLLGLFVGPPLGEMTSTPDVLPPQIILFLENLWDEAGGDEEFYREEVRITYLHELGHYLGLDELDLDDRGLQ